VTAEQEIDPPGRKSGADGRVGTGADATPVPGCLGADEREWIAASYGDWEFADPPDPDPPVERERPWPEPDPVTVVPGVDDRAATRLADGGVVSVRVLAAADPVKVAGALGLHVDRVTSWHWWARQHVGADPLDR
jgi:hypothetical protein